MSDPKRWLEEKDAPAGLADLLESARMDEPSAEQLTKLRAAIGFLLVVPPGGGGGGGGGGAGAPPTDGGALTGGGGLAGGGGVATAAATSGLVGKTVAIALVVAGLGGGAVLLRKSEPAAQVDPIVAVAPPVAAPPVAPPVAVAEPEPIAVVDEPVRPAPPPIAAPRPRPAPAPAAAEPVAAAPEPEARKETPPVPPPAPAARIEDEMSGLEQAMSAAQSGRSADALAAVDAHVRAFPSSSMAQEREAIAIEALVNLGRMPEAKTRLEKFRGKWPTSTHLLRLESLIR